MFDPALAPLHAAPARRRHIPELLAPAGDWECARAAVENGADAIYFGLEKFNARMRAKNFTQADLPALMKFLHSRGVKGYVTFNTLVFTRELPEAESYLRGIIRAGADAAIVQDVGVCRLIRQLSPDFPIHCSTQMSVTSAAGVAFARELGTNLVVLARENSLAEIGKIQAEQAGVSQMPLEVFVHGALCVAYSGQCLTSESLGGRSANRGECAQACRLPYELVANGALVPLGDRKYLLSPRDLSGLDVLPALVASGVSSLKIEGRLKSPEYVASITRVYRAALTRLTNATVETSDETEEAAGAGPARYELEMSFSRGLATGWFEGVDNQKLVHARFGTKRGVYLGKILRVEKEAVFVAAASGVIKPGDGVVFDAGTPDLREEGGRIYEVFAHGAEVELRFGRGDLDWSKIVPGQRLWKTNDPALDRDVRSTFQGEKIRFTQPVDFELHGTMGDVATLVAADSAGNSVQVHSREKIAVAITQPLSLERLRSQLARLGGSPFHPGKLTSYLDPNAILPVSELNQLRRDAVAALVERRSSPHRWGLHSPAATIPADAKAAPEPFAPAGVELIAVIRLPEQLEAAWTAGVRTIYCEFENPKNYRATVSRFQELAAGSPLAEIWVAPPRVFKPGERWILEQVRSSDATGYLARNYDHLAFFSGQRMRGDFSLNVANPLTATYFLERCGLERVTASYDLNLAQLSDLLAAMPGSRVDITIHQHMPLFHMEHCVFCAFLSTGKDYRDCGRPCDSHRVTLRDRVGAELPLRADAGCRNTVFNNRAQTGAEYVDRLRASGGRNFRVEFLNENPDEVLKTLTRYQQLLRGEITGATLWRELKLIDQLGVTRGQMERSFGGAGRIDKG